MPPTKTGTIKGMTTKGFGFIAAPDGNESFFHQSACTSTPSDQMREGDKVSFTVGQGQMGPRAENVNQAPALRGNPHQEIDRIPTWRDCQSELLLQCITDGGRGGFSRSPSALADEL